MLKGMFQLAPPLVLVQQRSGEAVDVVVVLGQLHNEGSDYLGMECSSEPNRPFEGAAGAGAVDPDYDPADSMP